MCLCAQNRPYDIETLKWIAHPYFCQTFWSDSQKANRPNAEDRNSGARQETSVSLARERLGALRPEGPWRAQAQSSGDGRSSDWGFCCPEEYLPGRVYLLCTAHLWLHLHRNLWEHRVAMQTCTTWHGGPDVIPCCHILWFLFLDTVDIWVFICGISQFLYFFNQLSIFEIRFKKENPYVISYVVPGRKASLFSQV